MFDFGGSKNIQSNENDADSLLPEPLRSFLPGASFPTEPPNDKVASPSELEAEGRLSMWFSQSDSDPLMLKGLTKRQRILGFCLCLLAASFCLCVALVFLPIIMTPVGMRKYVLLHTLGSLLLIGSFSFLWGPSNHFKSLCTASNFPFTFAYFASLFASLYAVLVWRSALFAVLALLVQVCVLLVQVIRTVPGGRTGLWYLFRGGYLTLKGMSRAIPI